MKVLVAPLLVVALLSSAQGLQAVSAHATELSNSTTGQSQPQSNLGDLSAYWTPQQIALNMQRAQQKDATARAWMAKQANGGQSVTRDGVTRQCVTDPNGHCIYWEEIDVSGGGEWVQEPYYEPNWCGPSSVTDVMMHWNLGAVQNYGSISVPNNSASSRNDYAHYSTYSGSQGYMAWIAAGIYLPQTGGTGISNIPYANGAPAAWLLDGMNDATGTSYYIIHNPTNPDDMMGNVEYDVSHDDHPTIYLANAQWLPEWSVSSRLDHYVEGYGYGYNPSAPSGGGDNVKKAFYADSISASDTRAHAGDWSATYNTMYTAVSTSWNEIFV